MYHLPNEQVIFHIIFMFFLSFNWKAFGRKLKFMVSVCSLKGKLSSFYRNYYYFLHSLLPLLWYVQERRYERYLMNFKASPPNC